jgi:hypothetical protein
MSMSSGVIKNWSARIAMVALPCILAAVCGLMVVEPTVPVVAQDPPPANKTGAKPPVAEFEKYLSNSTLTGVFTIDGRPLNKLEEERYEIKSAKKVDGEENLWEITTRIKYGDKDLTVPVFVNIEWVGRTPMIVLDNIAIPGLGTFSARVVFHDRKYAGTWKHDNVGGHLFGRVEPADAKPAESK